MSQQNTRRLHQFLCVGVAILFFAMLFPASGADVISIWGGARGTIILKSDGTVWTWGANFDGKLGIGETNIVRSSVPVEVHGPGNVGYLNSIKAVMGGEESIMWP